MTPIKELDWNISHREVLIEKVFTVEVYSDECIDYNFVWYSKYMNCEFKVRNSTKIEFEEMRRNRIYCDEFKSRLSKGFYVVIDDNNKAINDSHNNCYIGKRDVIILKK